MKHTSKHSHLFYGDNPNSCLDTTSKGHYSLSTDSKGDILC